MSQSDLDKQAAKESKFIAEEFNLYEINLVSRIGTTRTLDLGVIYTNLVVIENLNKNVLRVQVTLVDAEGWVETFPIIGDETLILTFANPHAKKPEDFITYQRFRIYDLQSSPSTKQFGEYTLFGVSEEYVTNMQTRISKRYTGLYSDAIDDLLVGGLGTYKETTIETTKTPQSVIVPNWTPFDAINFMASRSLSANAMEVSNEDTSNFQMTTGSFFVLYEKLNSGFYFESIENMIQRQKDNDLIVYFYAPRQVDGMVHENVAAMQGVEKFEILNTFDTMRNVGRGMYASRLIAYDPIRMKYEEVKYDYFKDANLKTVENRAFHDFVTMDGNKMISVGSDMLGTHKSMTKLATSTKFHDVMFSPPPPKPPDLPPTASWSTPGVGVTSKTFQDREATNNHVEDWLLQRYAQEQEFDNVRVKLTVAGNASRHVGDLIWFNLPSYIPTDDFGILQHELYGGYYMVSKIEHIITQNRYVMEMEIVKNSFLVDLPGNSLGYDRESSAEAENTRVQGALADLDRGVQRGF